MKQLKVYQPAIASMKWFAIDVKLKQEDIDWAFNIGYNITEPAWTIRPYKLNEQEMERIAYLNEQIGTVPAYAAIIMVPANSVCKTHVDDKADAQGVRQRITAINIPIRVHETSVFQYMEDEEPVETLSLTEAKCWRVDIPHRIDNNNSPYNRVVLSLSYVETVEEVRKEYNNV